MSPSIDSTWWMNSSSVYVSVISAEKCSWMPSISSGETSISEHTERRLTFSAKSVTRSAGEPFAAISASAPSTMRVSCGSYCWMRRSVKWPASSRRYLVCSGASIFANDPGGEGCGAYSVIGNGGATTCASNSLRWLKRSSARICRTRS
ncbi:hypothetical protein ACQ4WX_45795 [Streptomyces lasalocidi]